MNRKTEFANWLYQQIERTDSIGDLARYAVDDENAPRWAFRISSWRQYLTSRKAPNEKTEALEQAFNEFVAKGR